MKRINKILVATDLSDATKEVIEAAIEVARAFGASVDVVHVRDTFAYAISEAAALTPEQMAAETYFIDKALLRLAERLRSAGIAGTTNSLEGPTSSEILAHADKTAPDLIIVGTHGRGGIAHAVLGSVAERIVQKARRPVLVVPTPAGAS